MANPGTDDGIVRPQDRCNGSCETAAGCNCWYGVSSAPRTGKLIEADFAARPAPAEACTSLGSDEQGEMSPLQLSDWQSIGLILAGVVAACGVFVYLPTAWRWVVSML